MPLQVVEGALRHGQYLDILEDFTESVEDGFTQSKPWRFMQDGAPAHRPKIVKDFVVDNGFNIHVHPANSPDLNPIETIWGWMKQNVEKREPNTKQELEDAIFESGDSIPTSYIKKCIDHLKDYLHEVVEAEGHWPSRKVEN